MVPRGRGGVEAEWAGGGSWVDLWSRVRDCAADSRRALLATGPSDLVTTVTTYFPPCRENENAGCIYIYLGRGGIAPFRSSPTWQLLSRAGMVTTVTTHVLSCPGNENAGVYLHLLGEEGIGAVLVVTTLSRSPAAAYHSNQTGSGRALGDRQRAAGAGWHLPYPHALRRSQSDL